MKAYAIRWKSDAGEDGCDLIRTRLSLNELFVYYHKEQHWLEILSIDEVVECFNTLTKSSDGRFLLDGEE